MEVFIGVELGLVVVNLRHVRLFLERFPRGDEQCSEFPMAHLAGVTIVLALCRGDSPVGALLPENSFPLARIADPLGTVW